MAITLEEYLNGFDLEYADHYSVPIALNASILLARVNLLLDMLAVGKVEVTSGWRPGPVNQRVKGAAKASSHIMAHGIDIADPYGYLATKLLQSLDLLAELGLYLENPQATAGNKHIHLQDTPPASGRRVFDP